MRLTDNAFKAIWPQDKRETVTHSECFRIIFAQAEGGLPDTADLQQCAHS